mmetsp:Transcript_28869/g.45690  ORF Transcript_28869/g.45690 Transcript_28869/m.45690 type:complete len:204 (-) Transcript_28869:2164-2775(-)
MHFADIFGVALCCALLLVLCPFDPVDIARHHHRNLGAFGIRHRVDHALRGSNTDRLCDLYPVLVRAFFLCHALENIHWLDHSEWAQDLAIDHDDDVCLEKHLCLDHAHDLDLCVNAISTTSTLICGVFGALTHHRLPRHLHHHRRRPLHLAFVSFVVVLRSVFASLCISPFLQGSIASVSLCFALSLLPPQAAKICAVYTRSF